MASKLSEKDKWNLISRRAYQVLLEAQQVTTDGITDETTLTQIIQDCQQHRSSIRKFEDEDSTNLIKTSSSDEVNLWINRAGSLETELNKAISSLRVSKQRNEDSKVNVNNPFQYTSPPVSNKVRLPKLQIPEFSGQVEDWDNWFATYSVHIHKDTQLAGTTKYAYLIQYVKGVALQIVKNYQGTDQGYDAAIKALLAHYDDPNRQQECVIDKLYDLKAPEVNNNKQLQEYTLGIQGILNDLDNVGINLVGVEPLVRRWIVRTTPETIMQKVYESQGLYPSLKKIIKGFDTIIRSGKDSFEYNSNASTFSPQFPTPQHDNPCSHNQFQYSSHPIQITGTPQEVYRPTCIFCKQSHKSGTCSFVPHFQDRTKMIVDRGLCVRCIGVKHNGDCQREIFPCLMCNGDHHTWLCDQPNRTVATVSGEL